VPLQKRRSLRSMTEPWERFSLEGTSLTSARQLVGSAPVVRPFALAAAHRGRVLVAVIAAALGRHALQQPRAALVGAVAVSTSVRGQPLRSAARKCLRMCGYLVFEKVTFCTPEGVMQPSGRSRGPRPQNAVTGDDKER
jgi:hypothetical protein